MNTKNNNVSIDRLFNLLDEWRELPAYQLERRADIFFALHLEEILGAKINLIIPEFPVKKKETHQSFKIDYVAITANKVYFIELKTDNNSRNKEQDKYLEEAKLKNVKKLIDEILEISSRTKAKNKYKKLLSLISKASWFDETLQKNISTDNDIEIVYIQPNKNEKTIDANRVITFDEIIQKLRGSNNDITQRFVSSLKEWKSPIK